MTNYMIENNYDKYLLLFGSIPDFLIDYMELPFFRRLNGISLQCGMDYSQSPIHDFAFMITRFKHSLGTALLTWRLTGNKAMTIAALFHDVATPVFSHTIDYMNGDFLHQESTEESLYHILSTSEELMKLLKRDHLTLESITDFKRYSVVDLERPKMCADRLDNVICNGFIWVKNLTLFEAHKIFDDTTLYTNEDNKEEIGFRSEESALKVCSISEGINALTHTREDQYMMLLLSQITRHMLEHNYVSYEDLFIMEENQMIGLIENLCRFDYALTCLWEKFKTTKEIPSDVKQIEVKKRLVNPLVKGKRLIPNIH